MSRLTEKLWFLTAAICLLTTLGTYACSATSHRIKEMPTENVEFEKCEAIAERLEKHCVERRQSYNLCIKTKLSVRSSTVESTCPFFVPAFERDNLNGLGGYLRT